MRFLVAGIIGVVLMRRHGILEMLLVAALVYIMLGLFS